MAHKQILCAIEHRCLHWENTDKVMETKRTALARIQQNMSSAGSASESKNVPTRNAIACCDYQTLLCSLNSDHDTEGKLRIHCCAFCLRKTGFRHSHPEVHCKKCRDAAKGRKSRGGKRKRQE